MTSVYNRSQLYDFNDFSEEEQEGIKNTYSFEESDAQSTTYVKLKMKDRTEILPLCMFIKTDKNNFTHGIFGTSYFSGYFITLNKSNDEAVISYKYF